MMEWFKNLNVIVKSGVGIVVTFFIICIGIYVTVSSEIPSPITNDQWVTIISTFFAGTLGGLIALGGIWWQLSHEKEQKKERVNIYIKYILKKNLKKDTCQNLLLSEGIINYSTTISDCRSTTDKLLYEFDTNYINENIENILGLKNGVRLFDLSKKVSKYNETLSIQLNEYDKKNRMKNSFESLKKEFSINNPNSNLKNLMGRKLYFIYLFVYELTRFTSTISLLLTIDKSKLKILNSAVELDELKMKFKDIFEKIDSLKEGKLSFLEALKITTCLNKSLLNKIDQELSSLHQIKKLEELKTIEPLYSNFINYLHKDQRMNGLALEIYEELIDLDKKI